MSTNNTVQSPRHARNRVRRMAGTAAIIGAALIMATAQSFAAQKGSGNGGTTMKDLKDKGYKCVYVSTNFYECTKAGEDTYWCDGTGQACVEKPMVKRPNSFKHRQPAPGGMKLENSSSRKGMPTLRFKMNRFQSRLSN